MLKGGHIIMHPLLVLTTNQVKSFNACSQEYGSVVKLNLNIKASHLKVF